MCALYLDQELRKQLELLFEHKLKDSTHFDIHLQAKPVVKAVLELVHSSNPTKKSDGLQGAAWGQEEDHIYSNTNKIPLRRYGCVCVCVCGVLLFFIALFLNLSEVNQSKIKLT